MSDFADDVTPELLEVKQRFLARMRDNGPWGPIDDDEFMSDAVALFCKLVFHPAMSDQPETLIGQAARAVAIKLMLYPDLEKDWRVSFPSVFSTKETTPTAAVRKRRDIAVEVCRLVDDGVKVTHAIARVAANNNASPQKVAKDFYDWRDWYEAYKQQVAALELQANGVKTH